VDDEVEGLYRLFLKGDHSPTNIGNPGEFTMLQLADLVIEMTGSSSKIEQLPLPQDDPRVRRPDISRARKLLGWEPSIPLKDGLRRTIEFFRTLPSDRLTARPQPKSAFAT
jgi:nucleoside-diphosphate-sugar epimerase